MRVKFVTKTRESFVKLSRVVYHLFFRLSSARAGGSRLFVVFKAIRNPQSSDLRQMRPYNRADRAAGKAEDKRAGGT